MLALALLVGFPPAQHPHQLAKLFPDSQTYLTWTVGRPPTPWLFYALVGKSWTASLIQTLLSIICWTAFGWFVLGTSGALCGAALALAQPVALWNFTILSEPLTLTSAAALLAATVALGRRWTRGRAGAWAVCALLFTGVRVENFVLVPILAAALLAVHRAHWRWLAAAVAAIAAVFVVFGVLLDKESGNWQNRMTNVVLTRILPDQDLGPDFQARGLPVDVALLGYRGQMLKYYDPAFRAATPDFQWWLDHESRSTYLRWLCTIAPHRLLITWMNVIMRPSENGYYSGGIRLSWVAAALRPVYATAALPFSAWVWLAAVPLLCAIAWPPPRFADAFALAYLIGTYAMAFVAYHGDTGELDRHMLLASVLYRFAPVVVLGSLWARLADRRRAR